MKMSYEEYQAMSTDLVALIRQTAPSSCLNFKDLVKSYVRAIVGDGDDKERDHNTALAKLVVRRLVEQKQLVVIDEDTGASAANNPLLAVHPNYGA